MHSNGGVWWGANDGTGVETAAGTIVAGKWYHVAAVMDRTTGSQRVYIDGVLKASSTISTTATASSSAPLLIGDTPEVNGSYSPFLGRIDDVRVWSIVRTATQIAAAKDAPLDPADHTGLALYLPLDESEGRERLDFSANNAVATVRDRLDVVPGVIVGSIAHPGQVDRYTFTLAERTRFYFDALTDTPGLFWTLSSPTYGTVVSGRNFQNSDSVDGYPLLDLGAGDWTLTFDASGDGAQQYAFRLLDRATATVIEPGRLVTAALPAGTATLLYRFDVAAGDSWYFDGVSSVGGDVRSRILDPYGAEVAGSIFMASDVGPMTFSVPGTYYLSVEGRRNQLDATQSVSFRLDKLASTSAATPIDLDAIAPVATPLDHRTGRRRDRIRRTVAGRRRERRGGRCARQPHPRGVAAAGRLRRAVVQRALQGQRRRAAHVFALPQQRRLSATSRRGAARWGRSTSRRRRAASSSASGPTPPWWRTARPGNCACISTASQVASKALGAASFIATTGGLRVGREINEGNSAFVGAIDDVRVWNVARSAADIAANRNTALTGSETGLTLNLRFDEASGTAVANSAAATAAATPGGTLSNLLTGADGAIVGRIAQPGEIQRFSFSLAAQRQFYFDALTDTGNLFWSLTSPTYGTLVSGRNFQSSDSVDGYPLLDLGPGDYTLTFDFGSDGTGVYAFRFIDRATATEITDRYARSPRRSSRAPRRSSIASTSRPATGCTSTRSPAPAGTSARACWTRWATRSGTTSS